MLAQAHTEKGVGVVVDGSPIVIRRKATLPRPVARGYAIKTTINISNPAWVNTSMAWGQCKTQRSSVKVRCYC